MKSASGYTCTRGQPCPITNGAGVKETPTGSCEVVDCDAGYDSTQAPTTQCQQTASGFYSLANNKGRTACPTPPHSSATTTTELSSADGCYTCDGGYLKNTARNTCDVPSKGTYVNASGTEVSCNPITTLQGGATATWIRGAAATADACPFSCSPGFVKTGRACNIPGLGKYADSSGDEQSCNNPTGGFNTFLLNTGAVETATDCGFSCNAGFVKKTVGRTCATPDTGKYADSSGDEQSCDTPTGVAGGFKEFLANTGAVSTAAGCDFSCNAGFVKNTADRTCNIPDTGNYADGAGAMQSCSTPTGGFNTFLPNTGAVSTADGCGFSCNAGFVKISADRTCAIPDTGKYADSSGDEQSCNNPTSGFKEFLANTGAVSTAAGCGFSCNAGFVKNTSDRTCNIPDTGNYADGAGAMQSCSPPTGATGGFNTFLRNTGAVDSATGCDFSCNAGFMKDSSAWECKYPTPGTYADAQGAEISCTDITGITGFGSWLDGAATDEDSCPFSCASGYTVSGRTCRRPENARPWKRHQSRPF